MRTIFHKVSGNTAIVIEGGFRPDDNSQKNGSVLSLRVTTGDEAPSRVGKRLLRKVYPERNVMKSKPVLPAPVQQAQVSLSKGARNHSTPEFFSCLGLPPATSFTLAAEAFIFPALLWRGGSGGTP